MLGQLLLIAVNENPAGALPADGSTHPINDQTRPLAVALGNSPTAADFQMPDLRGVMFRGASTANLTAKGSDETKLGVSQLPEHTHQLRASDLGADNDVPGGPLDDADGSFLSVAEVYRAEDPTPVPLDPGSIGAAGSDDPDPVPTLPKHVEVRPFLSMY